MISFDREKLLSEVATEARHAGGIKGPVGSAMNRKLAVLSRVDPRTVSKVLTGSPVRGDAESRVLEVVREIEARIKEPKPDTKTDTKRPPTAPTMRKGEVGRRKGNTRVVVYIKPEDLSALEEAAKVIADARGALRPDTSEALRLVLSAWRNRPKATSNEEQVASVRAWPQRVQDYLDAISREVKSDNEGVGR